VRFRIAAVAGVAPADLLFFDIFLPAEVVIVEAVFGAGLFAAASLLLRMEFTSFCRVLSVLVMM
jgi:hypothetical protein